MLREEKTGILNFIGAVPGSMKVAEVERKLMEVRKETPLPCRGPILSSHFVFWTQLRTAIIIPSSKQGHLNELK